MHPVQYRVICDALDQLTDAQALDLHAELSRRAQAVRSRDPAWRENQREGTAIYQRTRALEKGWTLAHET